MSVWDVNELVAKDRPGPVTVRLSDVEPERLSWLWPGRLPAGKLVVLDGDPAVGKSTLSVDLAAHITTGAPWPDGERCPRGGVLILSAEDGLADTIRPRIDAAGGDPSRVHALTEIRYDTDAGESRTRPPTLADISDITAAIASAAATLVVIDVLMAYLPGRVDSHRDQDVRGVLAQLGDVATAMGATILLLRHLNKASGGSPLYRGGGSIGIVGAARAAFLAAHDPDDDDRRVLACTKSNLAAMPPALAYHLVDSPQHHCARVEWLGHHDASAADLLRSYDGDEDQRTERDEAVDWLICYLADRGGRAAARDAIKAAMRDGIAKTTLTKARKRAGVESTKAGFGGGWVWNLDPRRIPEESQGPRSQNRDSSDSPEDSSARLRLMNGDTT